MITVLVTSFTPLEEAGQLYYLIIQTLMKSAEKLKSQQVGRDGATSDQELCISSCCDSTVIVLPIGSVDMHVNIKLSHGRSDFSSASPHSLDGWKSADVLVYVLDLSDRQSFDELKRQYSHFIAYSYRAKKASSCTSLLVYSTAPAYASPMPLMKESAVRTWCVSKSDVHPLSLVEQKDTSVLLQQIEERVLERAREGGGEGENSVLLSSSHCSSPQHRPTPLSSQVFSPPSPRSATTEVLTPRGDPRAHLPPTLPPSLHASLHPPSSISTEEGRGPVQSGESLKERRRRAFEQAMFTALEADRTADEEQASEGNIEDDYGSVCSQLSLPLRGSLGGGGSGGDRGGSGVAGLGGGREGRGGDVFRSRSDDSSHRPNEVSLLIEKSFNLHHTERLSPLSLSEDEGGELEDLLGGSLSKPHPARPPLPPHLLDGKKMSPRNLSISPNAPSRTSSPRSSPGGSASRPPSYKGPTSSNKKRNFFPEDEPLNERDSLISGGESPPLPPALSLPPPQLSPPPTPSRGGRKESEKVKGKEWEREQRPGQGTRREERDREERESQSVTAEREREKRSPRLVHSTTCCVWWVS